MGCRTTHITHFVRSGSSSSNQGTNRKVDVFGQIGQGSDVGGRVGIKSMDSTTGGPTRLGKIRRNRVGRQRGNATEGGMLRDVTQKELRCPMNWHRDVNWKIADQTKKHGLEGAVENTVHLVNESLKKVNVAVDNTTNVLDLEIVHPVMYLILQQLRMTLRRSRGNNHVGSHAGW